MEADNKTVTITSTTDEIANFTSVATLAKTWMIDFSFLSLCRYFKEGKLEEFNQTVSTMAAVVEGVSNLKAKQKKKICGFLARIMHSKQLDVHYDQDERMTPLMSAVKIWPTLREIVADDSLFENVTNLLYVQSVSVCLEKGHCSMASSVLQWLQEECDIPQNLGIKLSFIVNKKDTYHPFLLNFSFSRLLETIQTFLDSYLEEHPSDFLLKAATKVLQSCPRKEAEEDSPLALDKLDTTSESSDYFKENKETTVLMRPKKKLLSTKNVQPWKPESGKKPLVSLGRNAKLEATRLTFRGASPEATMDMTMSRRRRPSKKWTYELDMQLKAGVKRHGEGKWASILQDYDFRGRTGVMLKDRWRNLKKSGRAV